MNEKLMEEVVSVGNYRRALQAVKRNKGAGGIDGMKAGELEAHLGKHWEKIRAKLLKGTYVPTPAREVEIPKPSGGTRVLGILTVLDRFISQLLLQGMSPIFEPGFSEQSYGFRPNRSAPDAVKAAQKFAQEGKRWVIDIDICGFFDHVNHDILMHRIGQSIRDKRVLHLIGRFLRRGAMIGGLVRTREEGTPQGSPLSPLLANIYLDRMDKELERRGHSFCRYADDANIYVGSEVAAIRVKQSVSQWIEKHLKLQINEEKSGIGRVWERKFLGFQLNRELQIGITEKSVERLQGKVRELWRSCQSRTSEQLRDQWCAYIRGWWNYFQLAQERQPIFRLEGWIRRHIRKCFWLRWHKTKGRLNALKKLGLEFPQLKVAFSKRGAWRIASSPSLHTALSKQILRKYGFILPSDLATK